VGGAPGAGKSTVAARIADVMGWAVVRSDEVRKDLAGLAHDAHPGPGDARDRLYSPAMTAATYDAMADRARSLVESGVSVVLDATWGDRSTRGAARTLAASTASDLVELRCVVPVEIAAQRAARRAATGRDPSDATPEIAARLAAGADPWPEAIDVDTRPAPEVVAERALAAIGIPPSRYV
jgi:predicted kinase